MNQRMDRFLKGVPDGAGGYPRGLLIGTGALIGGLGLAWGLRRLSPRLYLAPGWPGRRPHWSPADNAGVGTALGTGSTSASRSQSSVLIGVVKS